MYKFIITIQFISLTLIVLGMVVAITKKILNKNIMKVSKNDYGNSDIQKPSTKLKNEPNELQKNDESVISEVKKFSFKRIIKKIIQSINLWPEFWSIGLGTFLWFNVPWLLYTIDRESGAFPTGEIQRIIFGVIALAIINGAVFLGIRFNFPRLYKGYKNDEVLEKNEEGVEVKTKINLTQWQESILYVCLYLGLMLVGAILVTAI